MKTGVIKKEGYLGGTSFTGVNYDSMKSNADINKICKKEFKRKFPEIEISCRGGSRGGAMYIYLYGSEDKILKNLKEFENEIKKYNNEHNFLFQTLHYLSDWDCDKYNTDYKESIKILYNKYKNQISKDYSGKMIQKPDELDKMILKSSYYEGLKYINELYDSFNNCDNNPIVDYFNNRFINFVYIQIK